MLAEVNSHDFDCVRWLTGSDIVRVYAETANRKGAPAASTRGLLRQRGRVAALRVRRIGTIDGTCPADYGYDARVEVVGTKGLL